MYGFLPKYEHMFANLKRVEEGGQMSKRYNDPIEVVTTTSFPVSSFSWRGKRYTVDHLLKHWVETRQGWDPERKADEEYFRVEAEGGTYDLLFDRLSELSLSDTSKPPLLGTKETARWRLARVWD